MLDAKLDRDDLDLLTDLGREAGQIAMKWFGQDPQVWMKEGQSPVSEADFAVDQFLKEKLMRARPDYGWLSEETTDTSDRLERERVFVVDLFYQMPLWKVSADVVRETPMSFVPRSHSHIHIRRIDDDEARACRKERMHVLRVDLILHEVKKHVQ